MKPINLTFNVCGIQVPLSINEVDANTINFTVPRPNPVGYGAYAHNASKKEFTEDIQTQIPKTLNGNIEELAFESLYQAIVKHINKFGRILPADLEGYVGQNVLLFNSILKAQAKVQMTELKQEELFTQFFQNAFTILPENLKAIFIEYLQKDMYK